MKLFKTIMQINWRNIQLVRFSDGKYGVRKGRLIYFYRSKFTGMWFTKFSERFTISCQMPYAEAVEELQEVMKPVKLKESNVTDTVIYPKENDQH